MKFLLLFLFQILSISGFSQEWININTPFVDPTPNPQWKNGNLIEIIYELDLKNAPDTSNPSDWITINELTIKGLKTDFVIGSKSYTIDFPGTSVIGGKFKFKLYGPDFDSNEIIKKENWKAITYHLKYLVKNNTKETQSVQYTNYAYKGVEGTITINRLEYNISDKEFEVEIYSSHESLNFKTSQIFSSPNGIAVATFKDQREGAQVVDKNESKYSYKLKLTANSAYDIVQLSAGNGHRLFAQINGASSINKLFSQSEGMFQINYSVPLIISNISGTTVHGINPSTIDITTNLPSNSIKLIFDDFPYETTSNKIEINGTPFGTLPSNIFSFSIPSHDEKFMHGRYRFHFEGKPAIGNPMTLNYYTFEKKIIDIQNTTIVQEGNDCKISVSFKVNSPGDVQLIFAKTKDSKTLTKVDGQNLFQITLNLSDQSIKDNLIDLGSDKFLNVYVKAFGVNYNESGIKVNVVDTKKAVEELVKIEGTKKKKKEKINQYLSEKNFIGDTEKMTDTIFAELLKSKDKRNWSETWKSVSSFLKPLGGLVMLLI